MSEDKAILARSVVNGSYSGSFICRSVICSNICCRILWSVVVANDALDEQPDRLEVCLGYTKGGLNDGRKKRCV